MPRFIYQLLTNMKALANQLDTTIHGRKILRGSILEEGIANLEDGDAGFACSSGMAAIQLVLTLFRSGDELIVPEDIYGGTYRLLDYYADFYTIRRHILTLVNVNETRS